MTLESSVGSRKSTQSIDAPGESKNFRVTSKMATEVFDSLCTPIDCASFSHPTAESRMTNCIEYDPRDCRIFHIQAPHSGAGAEIIHPAERSDRFEDSVEDIDYACYVKKAHLSRSRTVLAVFRRVMRWLRRKD